MENSSKKISKLFLLFVVTVLIAAGCNTQTSQTETQSQNTNSSETAQSEQATKTVSYKGEDGKNALELLQSKYTIETKEFPGVGKFVQSINGIIPDSNHFWAFYVNGATSNLGAAQYITKSSDQIEWRLEEIKQ